MKGCIGMLLCVFLVGRIQANDNIVFPDEEEEDKYSDAIYFKPDFTEAAPADDSYDYCTTGDKGPAFWPIIYRAHCSGNRQSPIDLPGINSYDLTVLHNTRTLNWNGYSQQPNSMTLTNDGKTVVLRGTWDKTPTISGGLLNGTYRFAQAHFHWGMGGHLGSEHSFDGEHYPIEIHAVHYRTDFGNFSNAVRYKGGIVVLAYMGTTNQQGSSSSSSMSSLYDPLGKLLTKTTISINPFPLDTIVKNYQDGYYFYHGSLTTPTCNEVSEWMVSIHPNYIPLNVLTQFRQVSQATECMENNFRPTQPRNGREIIFVEH